MAVIGVKSITGITSITNAAGGSDLLTFHSNNTTERFRIGTGGQIGLSGANYGSSGQVLTSQGSGSAVAWSTITGTTINNNAANRIITGEGGTTLNGEANLTYNGNTFSQAISNAGNGMNVTASGDHWTSYVGNSNRSSANTWVSKFAGQWNSNDIASIACMTGADTTNKDEGQIAFYTTPSGGGETERMRITSGGDVLVATTTDSLWNDTSGGGLNLKTSGQLVIAKQASSASDPLIWLNDTGQTTNKTILLAQDGTEKANIGLAGNDLKLVSAAGNLTLDVDAANSGSSSFCAIKIDGSEKLRINSGGGLLLGTTTAGLSGEADNLTVYDGAHGGITIRTGTSHNGSIYFADGTTSDQNYRGSIQYRHADDALVLKTNATERLRITSAGDVGMDTSPANYSNYKTFTVGAGSVGSIIELRGATSNFEHLLQNNNGDLVFEADFNNAKANTNVIFKVDNAEKIRLDHNGKFLIGTTADTAPWGMESRLQLCGVDGTGGKSSMSITRHSADAHGPNITFGKSRGTGQSDTTLVHSADKLGSIYAIGADGNSWEPSAAIEFNVDTTPSTGTDMPGRISFWTCPDGSDQLAERMRIDNQGNIGVKCGASGKADLRIYHSSNPTILLGSPQAANCGTIRFAEDPNWFGGGVKYDGNANLLRIFTHNANSTSLDISQDVTGITLTRSGANVNIPTSLSKSSGSFRIDHPLDSKKDTHYLVHSFIEGPQADLIYRGVATLSSGTATVNIDTSAGMTEGTFVALCDDVSCFTSNETDWTAVKGSVSGNILTITAQDNSSTAKVSWLVIGERKDSHMLSTPWTDSNGKVIVEPAKGSAAVD